MGKVQIFYMAKKKSMNPEKFLDTSYAIALSSSTDDYHLYCQRNDKNWGIVDCISFIVMEERRITEALTTDIHFQQAGFRALLRDQSQGRRSPFPHHPKVIAIPTSPKNDRLSSSPNSDSHSQKIAPPKSDHLSLFYKKAILKPNKFGDNQ